MTIMGLDYLKHKETQRSNLANERETHRSNLANETERNRSNLVNEAETHRSNLAREAETNRSNLAREFETNRSNVQNELLKDKELGIKLKDVAEKIRHNQRAEDLDSLKISMSNLPRGVKDMVGMVVAKEDPTLGAIWDNTVTKGNKITDQAAEQLQTRWPSIKGKILEVLTHPASFAWNPNHYDRFAYGVGRKF